MPERFSSLKQLREKLWNKAVEEVDGKKKIYTQVQEVGTNYSIEEELLLPIAQQTGHTNLCVAGAEIGEGIPWSIIESGYIKVKANPQDNWWQYYDPEARGGRKKTRRKKVVKRERQENVPEGDYLKVNQLFQLILNLEILIILRMYKEKKMFLLFLK